MIRVVVQAGSIDVAAEAARLGVAGVGAVATFVGVVRPAAPALVALTLEHWPGRTERALEEVAREAARRWKLGAIGVVHRHGRMAVGEVIVFVGAAGAHRAAALDAVAFVIDRLKTRAPFWKREEHAGGKTRWIDARADDDAADARWDAA